MSFDEQIRRRLPSTSFRAHTGQAIRGFIPHFMVAVISHAQLIKAGHMHFIILFSLCQRTGITRY
jgi:hypothetical protein